MKILYFNKKIQMILALLLICVLTGLFFFSYKNVAVAESDDFTEQSYSQYKDLAQDASYEMQKFIGDENSNNYNRTFGTEEERNAALYIASRLNVAGYNLDKEDNGIKSFTFYYNNKQFTSQNITAFLKCNAENVPTVVIGAHYDNVYDISLVNGVTNSHGVYDNGISVGALIALAKYLKNHVSELKCNVEFVFFGAEEPGCFGSKAYLTSLSDSEKSNLLLMINLDSIGGEYLYIYSDEVRTDYNDFYYSIAEKSGYEFKKIPAIKRTFIYGGNFRNLLYNFAPQNSDNSTFANAGFKTVSFVSGNLSTFKKVGFVESQNYPAIGHSKDDNLETFMSYYKDTYEKNLEAVCATVADSLMSDSLITTVSNAKIPQYNFLTSSVVGYVTLFVFIALSIIATYFYYGKLKKYALSKLNTPPTQTPSDNCSVFGEEYEKKTEKNNEDYSVFGEEYENKD